MKIGERLAQARKLAALTQKQVADQLHVTRTTISNWETGRSYPDIASLLALSTLYQLSLDTLIKEDQLMVDDLKQKERERRLARVVYLVAIGVDMGIMALFGASKYHVAGATMGPTIQWGLLALLWVNLIVIWIAGKRDRRLSQRRDPWIMRRRDWLLLAVEFVLFVVLGMDLWLVAVLAVGIGGAAAWHTWRRGGFPGK